MPHLKGLAGTVAEINSPLLSEWPLKIGQFLLNFGAIEHVTFHYLNFLKPTREAFNRTLDMKLVPRIDHISKLIRHCKTIDHAVKEEMLCHFARVKELATLARGRGSGPPASRAARGSFARESCRLSGGRPVRARATPRTS